MKKLILAALLVSASAAAAETPVMSFICPMSDGAQIVMRVYGNDTIDMFEQGTQPGPRKALIKGSETPEDVVLQIFNTTTHQLEGTVAVISGHTSLMAGDADGECSMTQHRGS